MSPLPGEDVVDWISYDPYESGEASAWVNGVRLPIKGVAITYDDHLLVDDVDPWPGFYKWATEKAPGKPLMMTEWSLDLSTPQLEYLARLLNVITPTARKGLSLLARHRRRRNL